jgi:dynactin complex subunit
MEHSISAHDPDANALKYFDGNIPKHRLNANWCSDSSCRRSSVHEHRRRGHVSWHNQPDDNQKMKGQKHESITSNINTT